MAKDKTYKKLISSKRWLQLRKKVLSKHPLCQDCEAQGKTVLAEECHHIKPVESAIGISEAKALMFDIHNVRALCHDCHVKAHKAMGKSGKQANKRIMKERLAAFISTFLE